MNFKKSLSPLLLSVSTALLALFSTTTASGQMEYMAEAMQPEYMVRDLVVFAEGLNLDDTQEVIVEAMFDSYEDEFRGGWAALQVRINGFAEEREERKAPVTLRDVEPVLNALGDWMIEKRHLDEGFLESVKTILIGQQRELWPGFVQRLYREKHVSLGRISGESVDLFQIVRDADLPPAAEAAISELLNEYAIALDVAMRTRDAILRGNPKKLFDNILSGNSKKSPDLVDNLIRARVEVRDLNDRYIEIISGHLAGQDSEDFRTRALKRGYTRIYRRTPAQRILRQARENESYSEGLRAQIFQLEASYLQELEIINYDLLEKTRQYEPAMHRYRELAGQVRSDGGTLQKREDPTREVYKQREELGKRYIEMLRALLSPEEFLELDGSRRWIPRSEQQTLEPPALPARGKDGNLSLSGGTSSTKGKGKDDKDGQSRPNKGSGTSNNKDSGLGRPGS